MYTFRGSPPPFTSTLTFTTRYVKNQHYVYNVSAQDVRTPAQETRNHTYDRKSLRTLEKVPDAAVNTLRHAPKKCLSTIPEW